MAISITFVDAFAGVVPGTINKGTYTTSNTCIATPTTYAPTNAGGYCYQGGGKTGHWNYYQCNPYTVYTPDGCGGTIASTAYNTCSDWVWDTYYSYPTFSPYGANTYYSYSYNAGDPVWGSSGYSVILSQDAPQSCNRWANGTPHTPATPQTDSQSCTDGTSTTTIQVGGSNGVCDKAGSRDNLVTSFNQLGAISRSSPTDNDASCTVEGRYAEGDNGGPTISTTGISAFDAGDENNWCNMNKYQGGEITPGCTYYANRAGVTLGSDLLANMSVVVNDVSSGISSVQVELGSCSGQWDLPTDLGTILNSTTSPAGVKDLYKQVILTANVGGHGNISYTSGPMGTVVISGVPAALPSLRAKFGVARLDDCLTEGKNFLVVTANDSARSSADGVTFAPNTTVIDYSSNGYIKVDNSTPKLGLGGHMANFAESNTAPNCMVGPPGSTTDADSATEWKNFTLRGSIGTTDPFGNDLPDCVTTATVTEVALKCLVNKTGVSKPTDTSVIWIAPAGVNPTTGAFTGTTFGNIGPIPDITSCDWACSDPGKKYDPAQGKCISSTKLFILFNSGTQEATGPLGAKLDSDPVQSVGLIKEKSSACPAPAPTGSKLFTNFTFAAGATYMFPGDTLQYQIAENGNLSCPPADPTYTYSWYTGNFGSCTGACGSTGSQLREVTCKRNDGAVMLESFCTGPKPATTQACTAPVCPAVATSYSWVGDWGACSATYPSQRTRTLRCESNLGVTVVDAYCAGIPKPATVDTTACIVNYCTAGGTVPCVVKPADTVASVTPTCTDGTQNGTETGVDCGGSCGACVVAGILCGASQDSNMLCGGTNTLSGCPAGYIQKWYGWRAEGTFTCVALPNALPESGILCGASQGGINCNGHNTSISCPAGYTQSWYGWRGEGTFTCRSNPGITSLASGTLCGSSRGVSGGIASSSDIMCNGMDVSLGCPIGYTQAWYGWRAEGMYTCVLN